MNDQRISYGLAGLGAILAGLAWVAWISMNAITHGGLDAGISAVGPRLARWGQMLMVSWNLLLIPAALVLWRWLQDKSPNLMLLYTVCGVAHLLLWANGGATQITPVLEVSYLLLSGVWWVGTGLVLQRERKALGLFTVILGLFALLDALFSFSEPPFYIYVLAAPKLPLSIIWDFWLGLTLLRQMPASRPI